MKLWWQEFFFISWIFEIKSNQFWYMYKIVILLFALNFLQKPYDFTKYSAINFKMEDITDSFENGMFASMKRQTEEDYEDISASESPRKLVPPSPAGAISNKTPPNPSPREVDNNHRNLYDFSPTLTLTSDEDSTWQAPVSSLLYKKKLNKNSKNSS